MSHCLLTGGSSQIGHFLLPLLLAGEPTQQIMALARRPRPQHLPDDPRLHWRLTSGGKVDLPQPQQITQIISLGPLSLTLAVLPQCSAVRHVLAVTSSSIVSKQSSADGAEREQIRALAQAEQALIEQCRQRGIVCQVLRPTLIYGAGLDANVCALANLARRFGVIPVAGRAPGLRRPVHAADLATAIVQLQALNLSGVWTLAGGSTLSYRQLAEAVCQALQRGHVLGVPQALLTSMLWLAHKAGRMRAVNAAMIRRQQQDLLFDDHPARSDFGWSPRPLQLSAAMLQAPQQPASLADITACGQQTSQE